MIQSKRLLSSCLYFLCLAIYGSLVAEVNLRNGNYHIKYSDIVLKSGVDNFRLDREYNSYNQKIGLFGGGWSSELESKIIISKTQNNEFITLIEFGLAPGIRFFKDSKNLYRNSIGETIKISDKGNYVLFSSNQHIYVFGSSGKLKKKKFKSGYSWELSYDKNKIKSLKDIEGHQLLFSYFPNGLVEKVRSSSGTFASYKYSKNKLVYVQNEDKNTFTYKYSRGLLLNKILVGKKVLREINYHRKSSYVKKVIERDKKITEYSYQSLSKNHQEFQVSVKKNGEIAHFHYYLDKRKDGSEFVKTLKFTSTYKKIKTSYSPKCELPIRVEYKKLWETLSYNEQCQLIKKKDSKGNNLEIEYTKNHLIKNVQLNKYQVSYKYKDGIKILSDSKKRKVSLFYDLYGRARKVELTLPDTSKKEVVFDYSQRSLKDFLLKVNKKHIVKAYYDENKEIIFDEDIKDSVEKDLNIIFSTMNYMINAHKF